MKHSGTTCGTRCGCCGAVRHSSLTAVVTLALGIGANSAIFSVASGVLLRPLPYPAAERLAMVWMDNSRIALREDWHSFPDYHDYRTQSTTFEDMAIFNNTSRTLTGRRRTGARARRAQLGQPLRRAWRAGRARPRLLGR